MKVLIIVSSLLPGGAERVSLDLSDYLSKQRHETHLFVARLSKKTPQIYKVPNGVKMHYAPFGVESSQIRPLVNFAVLYRCIRKIKPNVIVSLGSQYKLLNLVNAFRYSKVVLSERNYPLAFYSVDELLAVRATYQKADKVVFQTEEVSELFGEIDSKKKVIIPNAANFSSCVWRGKQSNRVLYVGRLVEQKNPLMLIDSFSKFLDVNSGYHLDICGDGPLAGEMKNRCDCLGIQKNVHFHGHVDDVSARMQNSLMYVSTSDYEGMSNSMLEAMSVGMPVVCTDCLGGSARSILVSGKNGMLVPRNDSNRFASAMSDIANNRDMAEIMGENATNTLRSFSPEAIYRKWESVIRLVSIKQ